MNDRMTEPGTENREWKPKWSLFHSSSLISCSVILSFSLLLAACRAPAPPIPGEPAPAASPLPRPLAKNAVLMIGDGMGLPQVTLARLVAGDGREPLAMESLDAVGICTTWSASSVVTDSAAAATALATGTKTYNSAIGMDTQHRPLKTIVDATLAAGKSVGIVTTTRIAHATPACFYAHEEDRERERAIAAQLAGSGIQVFVGGGRETFKKKDVEALVEAGYKVLTAAPELAELARLGPEAGAEVPRLVALLAEEHLPYDVERKQDDAPLVSLVESVLALLARDRDGFFLLVEGGRIDHGGHVHDAPTVAFETLAFDRAVAAVRAFAELRSDTLVVVTADHATGDLGISSRLDLENLRQTRVSANTMADMLEGGGDAAHVIATRTPISTIAKRESEAIARSRDNFDRAARIGHLVSTKLGVYFYDMTDWETLHRLDGHDGSMVPVFGHGPGSERFGGSLDNTQIPVRIAEVLGIEFAPGVKE